MDLSQAFGLPSHPLIVHIPIVVIPLTLLAAIGAVAWPRGRRVLSLVAAGGAFVAFAGAQLATMSGEGLEERVRETSLVERHADLGEATRTLAALMLLAAVAYCARQWAGAVRLPGAARVRALLAPRVVGVVLAVALLATATLTTTWAVRTGHEGAKATWGDLPASAEGGD
jgi:uncharacterized membrane protein